MTTATSTKVMLKMRGVAATSSAPTTLYVIWYLWSQGSVCGKCESAAFASTPREWLHVSKAVIHECPIDHTSLKICCSVERCLADLTIPASVRVGRTQKHSVADDRTWLTCLANRGLAACMTQHTGGMSCPPQTQDCTLGCRWHTKLSWTDRFQGHLEHTLRSLSGRLCVDMHRPSQDNGE